MRQLKSHLSLAALLAGLAAAPAFGQLIKSVPPPPGPPGATPATPLKTDSTADDDDAARLLGSSFSSDAAGISFRIPAGFNRAITASTDEVGRYLSPDQTRIFSVRKLTLDQPAPLTTDRDAGRVSVGMLETVAGELARDEGFQKLRQDLVNLNGADAGLLAVLHAAGTKMLLTQVAVVRAADTLYYVMSYTSPAPSADADAMANDPAVRRDVATFSAVSGSVHLLDGTSLRLDQDARLFRTRTLFVNLTPARLKAALVPEQWLRLVKDGKDIGYSYEVEETGYGLPKKGERDEAGAPQDEGLRVGVRSRTRPEAGLQVDTETWQWATYDRKRELWSSIALVNRAGEKGGGKGGPAQKPTYTSEIGTMLWRDKPVAVPLLEGGKSGQMQVVDDHALKVIRSSASTTSPPIDRPLPPFYLPQVYGSLLPRLVAGPAGGPTTGSREKSYLFASFVTDNGEVMTRYVDVKPEREVTIDGKAVRAIPVEDKIGLDGSITTHYISPDGTYLGSINPDSKIEILPTDQASLAKRWGDANLTRPGAVK